jgi:hypothetical protein
VPAKASVVQTFVPTFTVVVNEPAQPSTSVSLSPIC